MVVFCGICGALVPCLDLGILVEPVPSPLKGSTILPMAYLVYFHDSFYFFFLRCLLFLASLEIRPLPPRGAWVPLCSLQKLPTAVVCGRKGACLRFSSPISLSVLDCDPECFQRKSLSVSPQISLSSIAAMEIRKPSLAGEFVWLWTGSGIEDTPTSKFLSHPGGKNRQDLIPPSEVCRMLSCGSVSHHGGQLPV